VTEDADDPDDSAADREAGQRDKKPVQMRVF
jgi:hypothetical protein